MKKAIVLFIVASLLYLLGAITVKYKLFPYNYIVKLKNSYLLKQKTTDDLGIDYLKNKEYKIQTNLYSIYKTKKVKVVMLGDSITFRVNWNELLGKNNIINRGINADTTAGFIHRLNNIYSLKPKYVFIMGGINDIYKGYSIDTIFNNYKKIIENLQDKNITPIVQSTLFTREKKHSKKVKELNSLLMTYCKNNKIDFINLNNKLSKGDMLLEKYATYDGVHLNANGYKIWREIIENYRNFSLVF